MIELERQQDAPPASFPITLTGKMRHGILWEARKALGGTTADLARYLGVRQTTLGTWINLNRMPKYKQKCWQKKRQEISDRLAVLTGHFFEDAFPDVVNNEGFLSSDKRFEIKKGIPVEYLSDLRNEQTLLPSPDEVYEGVELKEQLHKMLGKLKPQEEKVIKLRFGLDGDAPLPLDAIGKELELTRSRIGQIEAKALRKLRHPANGVNSIRGYLDADYQEPRKKIKRKPANGGPPKQETMQVKHGGIPDIDPPIHDVNKVDSCPGKEMTCLDWKAPTGQCPVCNDRVFVSRQGKALFHTHRSEKWVLEWERSNR